jgi:protein TonB
MVPPAYPAEARMRGINGWVDLTLSVNAAGEVSDAHIDASSKRMFERPAMTAVRKWRYEPMSLPYPDATESVRVKVQFEIE